MSFAPDPLRPTPFIESFQQVMVSFQNYENMATEVSRWLSQKESEADNPVTASEWSTLDRLFAARLYHQLTIKLLEFCKTPALQQGRELVLMYDHFLKEFETRICPLSLMEMVALIIKQMTPEEALTFLTSMEPKLGANHEAKALCLITKADVQLVAQLDIPGAKETLDAAEKILDAMDGVSSVHGRFYLLQSQMHFVQNETADYYRSALKFLGCTDISQLTTEQQQHHAEKLAVAALVADGIYNFGELLAHPILNALKGTSKAFLVDLLKAFNAGNITEFEQLQPKWRTIPQLENNAKTLRVKVNLLCLMEMTFKRRSTERQLTFKEITSTTGLESSEVEGLVMKAIAKGLVKGRIDQVGQKVIMTWVQPRVLDRGQISNLVTRLDAWQNVIYTVENMVASQAADILM